MATVLLISSQVAHGRVGASVGAFAIERLGVSAIVLPTTLLGIRPDLGAPGGGAIPVELLSSALTSLGDAGVLASVDVIVTGYMPSADHVSFAAQTVDAVRRASPKARFVCDAVHGDAPGGLYVPERVVEVMAKELIPGSDVLHVNPFEAGYLSEAECNSKNAAEIAGSLAARSVGTVIVSGLHEGDARLLTLLRHEDGTISSFAVDRHAANPKGTGDLLTALLAARMARGENLELALAKSLGSVGEVVSKSDTLLETVAAQSALFTPLRSPIREA
jgi:pyridoxine kinase